MSLLSALQSASVRLIGRRPSTFFSATGVFEQKLTDLANEVANDIMESEDWQVLTTIYNIVGDGVTENFPIPADFDGMILNSDIQNLQDWAWGYEHITDINDFIFRRARGFQPFPGAWIIYGNQFQFTPAPAVGNSASFPYTSKYFATDNVGVPKAAFTLDTDLFRLPDRLLTLGLVWRYRENEKLDYTGDMEAFQKAMDEYTNKDKGSQIIRRGRRLSGNFAYAYPWLLGS